MGVSSPPLCEVAVEAQAKNRARTEKANHSPSGWRSSPGMRSSRILDFTVAPTSITPNRDGVGDRAYINVVTSKKAKLGVYVTGPNGFRQDVPRREGYVLRPSSDGESDPGRYAYEYDGGIDLGADPPPAGKYVLNIELQDAIGQRDILTAGLTLSDSGRPQAEIAVQPNGEGVEWSRRRPQTVLAMGDTLYFTTTVRNTGLVPIRTGGPFDAAECYTMDQNRFSKGFSQESGAFRIGIDFESNTGMDHPWRWGVGRGAAVPGPRILHHRIRGNCFFDELLSFNSNGKVSGQGKYFSLTSFFYFKFCLFKLFFITPANNYLGAFHRQLQCNAFSKSLPGIS